MDSLPCHNDLHSSPRECSAVKPTLCCLDLLQDSRNNLTFGLRSSMCSGNLWVTSLLIPNDECSRSQRCVKPLAHSLFVSYIIHFFCCEFVRQTIKHTSWGLLDKLCFLEIVYTYSIFRWWNVVPSNVVFIDHGSIEKCFKMFPKGSWTCLEQNENVFGMQMLPLFHQENKEQSLAKRSEVIFKKIEKESPKYGKLT